MNAYWVDGHFIAALNEMMAYEIASDMYGFAPETVRLWTDDDQAELDAMDAD